MPTTTKDFEQEVESIAAEIQRASALIPHIGIYIQGVMDGLALRESAEKDGKPDTAA